MLGRGVAEVLGRGPSRRLVSDEVIEIARAADLVLLNLECCISQRGAPWPDPGKPFFFRAPPEAVDVLTDLSVDCVTLANNHALDYGHEALLDTLRYLREAGIACVGAGPDPASARCSELLSAGGLAVEVFGMADHPADFAAASDRPGIAYADLRSGTPAWALDKARARAADALVVMAHWGPNMTTEPPAYVRSAAEDLVTAGAGVVAGHSAHVFHGVRPPVLFDLGDFVDDYATDPILRNDLGLLWLVTLEGSRLTRIEAAPLKLDYCYTGLASGEDAAWIERRFRKACFALGSEVSVAAGRLVVETSPQG